MVKQRSDSLLLRWFVGLAIENTTPDHTTLRKTRQLGHAR
ncbi:transposase [Vogesella sp. AC12]